MRRDRSLCSSTSSSDRTEDRIKEREKPIRTSTANRGTKACYAFRDRMCVAHPYARVCVCVCVCVENEASAGLLTILYSVVVAAAIAIVWRVVHFAE